MNKYINNKRLGLLFKYEILSNYKSWLVFPLTIVGIHIIYAISIIIINPVNPGIARYSNNGLGNLFNLFLFIGGYVVSAKTFTDINDKYKSSLWFSLPGSSLEKYLVGAILSGIGFSILLMLSFVTGSFVLKLMTAPIFNDFWSSSMLFNPFTFGNIQGGHETEFLAGLSNGGINPIILVLIYNLTHSVFVLGSIIFKKSAFIKTILATSIVQLIWSLAIIGLLYITSKFNLEDKWDIRHFTRIVEYLNIQPYLGTLTQFMTRMTLIFGLPVSLFFNVVGYLKLSEKEVKGGV